MGELDFNKLLVLPEIVEEAQETKVHRAVAPDTSTLNQDQKLIFDEVMAMVNSNGSQIYLTKGYAGTGKTYLTNMLMEYILSSTSHRVAVTAPTNKAVKVLKRASKFSEQVLNLTFSTVHSMLGLREKIDGYGKQTFIKMRDEDVKVGQYSVIFLDEVSMLPDKIFNQLVPYLEIYSIKLIFIGDPAQIPPIGSVESIPLTDKGIIEYNIGVGQLTEILRQSADNPIIKITMKIRNALSRPDILPVRENDYNPENYDGVYFLGSEDKVNFDRLLETYFTSENFNKNSDFMKVLAYTNKTVNSFNRKIRKMIYGADVARICVGEKLIANSPIIDEKTTLYTTNDEFEVVSFVVTKGDYRGADMVYYLARVRGYAEEEIKTIKIIHEDSAKDLELVKQYLVDLALSEKKGSWEAAKKWKEVYKLKEVFADVKYNYAITVHKSQGSTYDNVAVMELDIDINRRIKERNRIKYTAFTRPRHKLFIVR